MVYILMLKFLGIEIRTYCNNDDRYDYNGYKGSNRSHIWPRITTPDLTLKLAREKYPDCGLPAFMQETRPNTAAEPRAKTGKTNQTRATTANKSFLNKSHNSNWTNKR